MKRIITLVLTMMIAFTVSAQKEVTKFLGIPVDGTKSAMIQKLKAKGFTYNAKDDYLAGEFNGRDVLLAIVTNNNKVYRIMVMDARGTNSETEIRLRFNTLCMQFSKNDKYRPADLVGDFEISEDENISYEMTVHDKRYEATYWQLSNVDNCISDRFNRIVWFKIAQNFGEYFIEIFYDNGYNQANGEDL